MSNHGGDGASVSGLAAIRACICVGLSCSNVSHRHFNAAPTLRESPRRHFELSIHLIPNNLHQLLTVGTGFCLCGAPASLTMAIKPITGVGSFPALSSALSSILPAHDSFTLAEAMWNSDNS